MKAAKLYTIDDIRIESMPVPKIGAGDLLVKIGVCGICSGDIMPWYIEKKAPLVLGHEPAGEVVEVGAGVQGFAVGDRVVLHHHAACLTCDACRRGFFSSCATWKRTNLDPGGIAEFVRVPAENVATDTWKMHPDTSYETGAFVEPLACCVTAMERMRIDPQDRLVIIGLGIMGLLNVWLAKILGVRQVIGVDCVDARMGKAMALGADAVIDFEREAVVEQVHRLTDGLMATKVLVGPGSIGAMQSGMQLAGVGGTVCLFAPSMPDEQWPIHPDRFYFSGLTLTGSYSCGPTQMKRSLEIVEAPNATFPTDALISARFPIERTAEAFARMSEGGAFIKSVVTF